MSRWLAFSRARAVAIFVVMFLTGFSWALYDRFYSADEPILPSSFSQVFYNTQSDAFAKVDPTNGVQLPADFSFNPNYQHGWWQMAAWLTDDAGESYYLQWNTMRVGYDSSNPRSWENTQLFVSQKILIHQGEVYSEQRLARGGIGQAGMIANPFRLWLDDWRWESMNSTPFPGEIYLSGRDFSVDLNARSYGPYVLPGTNGFVQKHNLLPVATYGFNAPFVRVNGELMFEDKRLRVSGPAWLGKEWGSGLFTDRQQGWDWLVLRLESGQVLSINRFRSNKQPIYNTGTLSDASGKQLTLTNEQISLTPLTSHQLDNGKVIPTSWQLKLDEFDLDVTIEVPVKDAWHEFAVPYWQGPIQVDNNINIQGFMQLTGY